MLLSPAGICGGMLNATTAALTITSPFFPNAYPALTSCHWFLDAPHQESVKVSVQTWALQQGQSCSSNYLEMSDWPVVSGSQGLVRRSMRERLSLLLSCFVFS